MKQSLFSLLLSMLILSCTAQNSQIEVIENDQGYLFTQDGENILFYQKAPKSFDGQYTRNNYIHPLWTLDGDTLTEDYPVDHAHHRGIFWTWHQIYVGDTRLGDAWECRDFVWDITDVVIGAAGNAKTLTATVLWKSPDFVDENGAMISAIKENSTITVYPKDENYRAVDFEISLLALQDDVKIGGSEDVKGYGGFSPRIKCPDDLTFLSSNGEVKAQNTAVEAGPWMNFMGTFTSDKKSGFAVLVHPENPQPINQWILREKRSMQNPVYPGREAVAVSTSKATVLKYRVIVHNGEADIATLYSEYER